MKKIIFLVSILAGFTAGAHPTDESYLLNLPAKSKITFSKELNILPNSNYVQLGTVALYNESEQAEGQAICGLSLQNYVVSREDRVIRSGSFFEVVSVSNNIYLSRDYFNFFRKSYTRLTSIDLGNGLNLNCQVLGSFARYDDVKIGPFKTILEQVGAKLDISPAVEFKIGK
ncbi:MAG: hypothetical protein ACOYOK_12480 [Pseudobdellovibrionaceae bacterium]